MISDVIWYIRDYSPFKFTLLYSTQTTLPWFTPSWHLVFCYCQPALAVQGGVLPWGWQAALRTMFSRKAGVPCPGLCGSAAVPGSCGRNCVPWAQTHLCCWRAGAPHLSSGDPLLFQLDSLHGALWMPPFMAPELTALLLDSSEAFDPLHPQKIQENKV